MSFHAWLPRRLRALQPSRRVRRSALNGGSVASGASQFDRLEDRTLLNGVVDADMIPYGNQLYDLAETFQLHSLPGASHTIYLDFDGHTTANTAWNDEHTNGDPFTTPAWTLDGNPSFSVSEKAAIQRIWARVAEDFAPFEVNVSTEEPEPGALAKTGSGDVAWGTRAVIGINTGWYPNENSGGVTANLNAFNTHYDLPLYVFNSEEVAVAETISHEVGHSLGLSHDGKNDDEYYQGQGSWAPIMGENSRQVTQWSIGEYPGATNTQDDLAIITSRNGFGYRPDDHGNFLLNATTLVPEDKIHITETGIIERNSDSDYFWFSTEHGPVSFTVNPAFHNPNLDLQVDLYNRFGVRLQMSDPTNDLNATISDTLSSGEYYLRVSGTGDGNAALDGYSDYGSLGYYTITGTISGAPVADPGGPYFVQWGEVQPLDASGSEYPTNTPANLTYEWDLDGDGIFGEETTEFGDEQDRFAGFDTRLINVGETRTIGLKVTTWYGVSDTAYTTLKVLPADMRLQYAAQFDETGSNFTIIDNAITSAGTTFIVGTFTGTVDLDPGEGVHSVTSAGGTDGFVVRLDDDGSFLSGGRFGGSGNVEVGGIESDGQSQYVWGSYNGTADFNPGVGTANMSAKSDVGIDSYLLKLNGSGSYQWARNLVYFFDYENEPGESGPEGQYISPPIERAHITANGSLTVMTEDGYGYFKVTSGGNLTVVNARESVDDATTPMPYGNSMVDAAGNIYIVGNNGPYNDLDPAGNAEFFLDGPEDGTRFMAKFNSSGDFVWAFSYDDNISLQNGLASLITDSDGNIYRIGAFEGTVDFDPGSGVYEMTAAAQFDYRDGYIAKYSPNGNFLWARQNEFWGTAFRNVEIDGDNNLYFSAYNNVHQGDPVDLDPGLGFFGHVEDGPVVVKYNQFGDYVASANARGYAVYPVSFSLSPNQDVVVIGWAFNPVDLEPGPDVTRFFPENGGYFAWGLTPNINSIATDGEMVQVPEGEMALMTGTYELELGSGDYELTTSVGTVIDNSDGTWSWSYTAADGPIDTQSVAIGVTIDGRLAAQTTFSLWVDNVAPVITASRSSVRINAGEQATKSGTFSDVPADPVTLIASHGTLEVDEEGTWDWFYDSDITESGVIDVEIRATDDDGAETLFAFKLLIGDVDFYEGSFDNGQPGDFMPTNPSYWSYANSQYGTEGTLDSGVQVSLFDNSDLLSNPFEVSVDITSISGPNRWLDGFIIFDYQNENDFKYAGFFTGQNQWVIGHYQGNWANRLAQVDWDDFGRTIDTDTAYTVHVRIDGPQVLLSVNGEFIAAVQFSSPVDAGQIGVGAYNAVTVFDDFSVGRKIDRGAPSSLPYSENFEDSSADEMAFVGANRWGIYPDAGDQSLIFNGRNSFGLGVAYFDNVHPLPVEYEIVARVESFSTANVWYDAFVIFDYQGPDDFKYAGMFVGQNQWVIGHFQGNWSDRIAQLDMDDVGGSINADQEYVLYVKISGDDVELYVDGIQMVSGTFTDGIHNGTAGVASYNGWTGFDDLEIGHSVSYGKPTKAPYSASFKYNVADNMFYNNNNRYWKTIIRGDQHVLRTNTSYNDLLSVAYVPFEEESTGSIFTLNADVRAMPASSGSTNGFLIFDYQHENDFKYVGFFADENEWIIGHYQGDWENRRATVDWDDQDRTINPTEWYTLSIDVFGSFLSFYVNNEYIASANFSTPLNEGAIGLAADEAFTWFDNFEVIPSLPFPSPAADPLFANWDEEQDELII